MTPVVWRYLFETVRFSDTAALLRASDVGERAVRKAATVQGLRSMAAMLRDGEMALWADKEVAWRQWTELFDYERRSQPDADLDELIEIRDALTLALVAWFFHAATTSASSTVATEAAAAAVRRLPLLSSPDHLLLRIDDLLSRSDVDAEWSDWVRQEGAEGVVQFVEDLRTSAQRVLIALVLLGHLTAAAGDARYFTTLSDQEVRSLAQPVRSALITGGAIPTAVSEDDVVGIFARFRSSAKRREAWLNSQRPLDASQLRALEAAIRRAYRENQRLPVYLADVASVETMGVAEESLLHLTVPRIFLIGEASAVGQDYMAADVGRRLADQEAGHALRTMIRAASRTEVIDVDDVPSALVGGAGGPQGAVALIPIEWRLLQAVRAASQRLTAAGIRVHEEHLLADDLILLLRPSAATWSLAEPEHVTFEYEEVPLRDEGEEAQLRIVIASRQPVVVAGDLQTEILRLRDAKPA